MKEKLLDGKEFGLFDDVVYKKNNSFGVGKICRIRKKGASRGYVEYKMPVKFDSNLKDISIVVAEYTCIVGNVDIFTEGTSLIGIQAEKLITTITLEYNVEENVFLPDQDEISRIRESFSLQARRRVNRVNVLEIVEAQQRMSDVDGTIRTTVEPHLNVNGQRRSSCRRTAITHFLE